jgi:hypothetical protein
MTGAEKARSLADFFEMAWQKLGEPIRPDKHPLVGSGAGRFRDHVRFCVSRHSRASPFSLSER